MTQSTSRTAMLVFTVATMVALGTVARAAPQGPPPLATGGPCPATLDPTLTCVMTGLDSPRGLAFGPEGALYVAEAGAGAGVGVITSPTTDPRCFLTNIGSRQCYGPTGAITRLWRDVQERIVTGLPSTSFPKGPRGIGAADIGFNGRGNAFFTIGWENDPNARATNPFLPDLPQFDSLARMTPNGEWHIVSDLGQFEADNNPDLGQIDSDPFGLLVEPDGIVIADAGANDLIRVARNGDISLLATFPSRSSTPPRPSFAPPPNPQTSDAVPTCVVAGPDGAYYIGELTGIPFTDKRANIYRLDPATDAVPHTFTLDEAFLTGFKTIIDIAFDDDGTLYVLQYATGALQMTGLGVLIKVVPDTNQSDIRLQYQLGTRSTVIANLHEPTSVAVGHDGNLYLSIRGTTAGGGEVIRIPRE
jgi:hypothetical protein